MLTNHVILFIFIISLYVCFLLFLCKLDIPSAEQSNQLLLASLSDKHLFTDLQGKTFQ